MASTDFFDDDLVQKREPQRRLKMGIGDEQPPPTPPTVAADVLPGRPVSDLNLTRLARHKEEVEEHVAKTTEELERLRQRQDDLEREKRDLQELRQRQDDYERGKRDIIEQLEKSLLTLEKEEIKTGQLADLIAATRKRFKNMLAEIQSVNDETWKEDSIRNELGKALAIIENSRLDYKKSMARIQSVTETDTKPGAGGAVIFEEPGLRGGEPQNFAHWFKVGLAASLPLIVIVVILTLLGFYLQSRGFL